MIKLSPEQIKKIDDATTLKKETEAETSERILIEKMDGAAILISDLLTFVLEGINYINSYQSNVIRREDGSIEKIELNIFREKYRNYELLFLDSSNIERFRLLFNSDYCVDNMLTNILEDPGMIYLTFEIPEVPVAYDDDKLLAAIEYIELSTEELIKLGKGTIIILEDDESEIPNETPEDPPLPEAVPMAISVMMPSSMFELVNIEKFISTYYTKHPERELVMEHIGFVSNTIVDRYTVVDVIYLYSEEPIVPEEPDPEEPVVP